MKMSDMVCLSFAALVIVSSYWSLMKKLLLAMAGTETLLRMRMVPAVRTRTMLSAGNVGNRS